MSTFVLNARRFHDFVADCCYFLPLMLTDDYLSATFCLFLLVNAPCKDTELRNFSFSRSSITIINISDITHAHT